MSGAVTRLVGHAFISGTLLLSGAANAQQCFTISPDRSLTEDETRAVVLTSASAPAIVNGEHFSLARTLDKIITTSRIDPTAPVTPADREALLESILSTFDQNTLTNEDSGLTIPVAVREREAALTAAGMLNPAGPDTMHPVGLFNRLDLAPKSLAHCGEYRIVYAKDNSQSADPRFERFFIIFEAALPNPDPSLGKEGCKEVASFWNSMSPLSDADALPKLERFYYEGGELEPGGLPFEPVIHYQHFGLPDGQVRANAFVAKDFFIWHLLQWETTIDDAGLVSLRNMPINQNPIPAFFGGPSAGALPADVFDKLADVFHNEFANRNVWQLIDVDRTAAIPIGPGASSETLINNVGVDIPDIFYAMESAAADSDDPAARAANTPLIAAIAKTLGLDASKINAACGTTPEHVLNRMGAMTCGGCHQFSNGAEIAPGIAWPESSGFVHINEDGQLSPLLTDHFLPARHDIVQSAISAAFVDLPEPAPSQDTRRVALNGALETLKFRGGGFVPGEDNATDVATALNLAGQLRRESQAEPGAFVTFRKPD